MNGQQVQALLEEIAKALTMVGVLPWWAYLLIVFVVLPILFMWHEAALKWPPGWDKPNESPPLNMDKDGTFHLDQKPPESYL